ncbi:MAG TPA: hypothetical protein DCS97_03365 [Planctomycetes bacterium]|nr:hypothetical protein [Planctomycetota bacterium]
MVSWTRLLAACLWAAYLLELSLGDSWGDVVTPTVRNLAVLSGVAVGILALLAARGGIDWKRPPWPTGWGFVIAAAPIFLLWRAGIPGLDHTAAVGRTAVQNLVPPATAAPAADPSRPRLDRLTPDAVRVVRVQAMLVRPVGRLNYLLPITGPRPPDPVALLRFRIICCVADANPVAVAVLGIPAAEVEDGMWVEVAGTVRAMDGGVVIDASSWQRIERPDNPYLPSTLPSGP